jgi:hypothetical protein
MEQHIQGGEREGEQKDKKEWLEIPRGCDYVLFVNLPRQGHGDVAVPLVSSTSSCCASNPPQAGSADQADF